MSQYYLITVNMGDYLSTPVKTKESEDGESTKVFH